MIEFANRILYTPGWEAFNGVAVSAGVLGLFVILFGRGQGLRGVLAWVGLGLLFVSLVFSMLFESLLPTLPTMPEERRLPYALRFVGYVLFVAMIIAGGRMLVMSILGASFVTAGKGIKAAGPNQRGAILRRLAPGLIVLAASAVVFTFSVMANRGVGLFG